MVCSILECSIMILKDKVIDTDRQRRRTEKDRLIDRQIDRDRQTDRQWCVAYLNAAS